VPGPEHRADVLFALPHPPRRVTLLGDLPGWRAGLAERQLEQTDEGADVVVASEDRVEAALAYGAGAVVVEGSLSTPARVGRDASRLSSLPLEGSPILFVDLDSHRAVRFAFARALGHSDVWRTLRNVAVGTAAGVGVVPPVGRTIAVLAGAHEPGFLSAAVRELGLPARSAWLMLVSPGSVVRRNAFLIFPPGARSPEYALKFGRVRGLDAAFDREEQGFLRVSHAVASVQERAPRYLGRFAVDGFHVSGESAAVGTRLSTTLRRPFPRSVKVSAVDRVARWLLQVARDSASRGGALAGEREQLERSVLPRWREGGDIEALASELRSTPSTFQHNDLAEENVIVRRGDFKVVDWEWAEPDGLPFGDLVYFGVHVLRLVDGVPEEAQESHFRELLLGQASSSPLFFGWVRTLARQLELPVESVARLVTLSWIRRADLSRRERERAEQVGGAALRPAFAERVTEFWLRDPELGLRWRAWVD
jgi:hypothetical protein